MNPVNHQIRLASRPSGVPAPSDWELTTEPVPAPGPGEFVVAVSHLSVDPAMRRWIDATPSYYEPVAIGAVMEAGAVGRVTASAHPGFTAGEHVYRAFGVQEFARSDGTGVTKLDPLLAPLPTYLGALGTTGLTAYFGLLDIGHPGEGRHGCRLGCGRGRRQRRRADRQDQGVPCDRDRGRCADKCRWITGDLGFDAAIDYKAQDVSRALQEHAPGGVDVFFDNVGGEILDAVLLHGSRAERGSCSAAASRSTARSRPADRPTTWS